MAAVASFGLAHDAQAATVKFVDGSLALTFKVYDPLPDFAIGPGPTSINEEGQAHLKIVVGDVTNSYFGVGSFGLTRFEEGDYGVFSPLRAYDFWLKFSSATAGLGLAGGYNGPEAKGGIFGGYLYSGSFFLSPDSGLGIDGVDYSSLLIDEGRITISAVPLPTPGLLLAGALGGLAVLRRRKLQTT